MSQSIVITIDGNVEHKIGTRLLRCVAALVCLCTFFLPVHAAQTTAAPVGDTAGTAKQVVGKAADDLLTLIESSRGYAKQEPERFYSQVEQLLSESVDFRSFARSVMAVHYKQATPEQRTRFGETFKWGLVRTYALALTEFKDGKISIVDSARKSKNPKRDSVKMEIQVGSGQIYPVIYSLSKGKEGTWKIRNIIINGINMGLTYRSQFKSAVKDPANGGDIDKVIDAWADVVAAEAEETAGAAS